LGTPRNDRIDPYGPLVVLVARYGEQGSNHPFKVNARSASSLRTRGRGTRSRRTVAFIALLQDWSNRENENTDWQFCE
jgi:hypothetical protein